MDTLTLSPLGLFMNAGIVVRCVMACLFLASAYGWYVMIVAALGLRRVSKAVALVQAGGDSPLLTAALWVEPATDLPQAEVVADLRRQMRARAAHWLGQAQRGLTDLAVIASVAPFVGLFGTVWGIMDAFAGLAQATDVGLQVVAPGIAEALAATAYGLAAAIPASIGYSRLGAGFNACAEELAHVVDDRAQTLARQVAQRGARPELGVVA